MKPDKHEIIVPILNDEYYVIVAVGNAKLCRQVAKKHHQKLGRLKEGESRGWAFHRRGGHPFIWLCRPPVTATYIGTLAHEAVHAITYIWAATGDDTSSEAFAHSVGAVVRTVMKAWKV